ncbi:MAG: carbon-nitrogen hydrolase family protein [Armatimonadota bacterium]|nr:carbon-nitrogen hydrolase family protein [Armatimonadota bacterium]
MKLLILAMIPLVLLGAGNAHAAAQVKSRVLTISTLCLLDGEEYRNLDHLLGMIEEAAGRGSHDLIVAPFTPFVSFREGHEEQDLSVFAKLARQHQTWLALAMPEAGQDGSTYYTSVLLDRDGRVAGKYRKTHALPDDRMALGDRLAILETDFGRVAFSITSDFYFPEVYTVEAMQGADILIWQHYLERFREHYQWLPLLKARCLDNHCHMVTSMYADPRTYITNRYRLGMQGAAWGRSMILNRAGTPIADTGYEAGVATAIVDLDRRKEDPYPYYEAEPVFFVNCMGDRTAFQPIAQPWEAPELPDFEKRTARVAVGYFWGADMWRKDNVPEVMLRLLDEAAAVEPDIVLLSEMASREGTETQQRVMEMVADRAREMDGWIIIGGLDDQGRRSHAWVWNRDGEVVFKEPIYWTEGFGEIRVLDTDFARIGIHTCGDLYMQEIDRVLALKGAEIIFDPSQMWGADGYTNEVMLRAHAVDNGVWMACAHWNSSDPGLRSVIVDPYGKVRAASEFQAEGVIYVDIDFEREKVYYAGRKPDQPTRGESGIPSYFSEDIPEQRAGWRRMIFERRRPELYGVIPTVNEVTMRYRPEKPPQ